MKWCLKAFFSELEWDKDWGREKVSTDFFFLLTAPTLCYLIHSLTRTCVITSPSSFNAADTVVYVSASSPVSKQGGASLYLVPPTLVFLFLFCFYFHLDFRTLFPVVGPFCTGRGGATSEMEGWGGVDPVLTVAMGTSILLCKTGDWVWTNEWEGEREREN